MMRYILDIQFFGGRGSSSGLEGGPSGPAGQAGQSPSFMESINSRTRAEILADGNTVLKELNTGGKISMTFDYSRVEATKMPDGKFQWNESGVSYNRNGSYSPFNSQKTVRQSAVRSGMEESSAFYISDGNNRSKRFSRGRG